jgi:outer membrane protein TolC
LSTTAATPNVAGGEAQNFVEGSDLSGDWWTLFHSQPLNALIDEALKNNHDLKAAQAAIKAAREHVLAQKGAYYPSVSAGYSASRQKQSNLISPTPDENIFQYNLFTPEVSVSYTPDVFGLNQRTVESLQAQEQQTRFQMVATYTTLTSNVVVAAIELGATQAQIDATERSHRRQYPHGRYPEISTQEGLCERARSRSPAIAAGAAAGHAPASRQAIGAVARSTGRVGRPLSQPGADDKFELASLTLPQDIPVSLPSKLVAQRPTFCRRKRTCIPPARRSELRKRTACPISN